VAWPIPEAIKARRTKRCTRVADRAFPDGESLGRNRVILNVRQIESHMDNIYPYVVPAAYLENFSHEQLSLCMPIGHDVYALLVRDLDGVCVNVLPEDIPKGLSALELHSTAMSNLETLAKGQTFIRQMHEGPDGVKFVVWSGHWLAASCCRLPRLAVFAEKTLGTRDVCISIPHRETMILFATGSVETREKMKQLIYENESIEQKQITWELFKLVESELTPID
jgi:hypothetical protein